MTASVLVAGGEVLAADAPLFRRRDVLVEHNRIVAVAAPGSLTELPADVRVLDASGLLVTPGLVDAQVNGAAGADLTREPWRLAEVAAALPRHGVTAFVPTVITSPRGTVERALAAAAAIAPNGGPLAHVVGVHAEGPFLSPARHGAHPAVHLRAPDRDLVAAWSRDAGVVAVTLAPELPGALDVVADLTGRGVAVWIGHSEATFDQAKAATAAGARAVTHLYNAMPPLHHRQPGIVGAVLGGFGGDPPDLVAGVIVDGLHLHPAVVRATWEVLGPKRFLLVSDTTAALDLPDGPTVLGDQEVVVAAGAVRLAADGLTLAGSGVGLDHCVRTLVATTGCLPAEAFTAATRTPATLLGRPDLGVVAPGARGDLAVWTPDLTLRAVLTGGRIHQEP
jgi:N-acetylglucosamine-6-phosphate deacetylase